MKQGFRPRAVGKRGIRGGRYRLPDLPSTTVTGPWPGIRMKETCQRSVEAGKTTEVALVVENVRGHRENRPEPLADRHVRSLAVYPPGWGSVVTRRSRRFRISTDFAVRPQRQVVGPLSLSER